MTASSRGLGWGIDIARLHTENGGGLGRRQGSFGQHPARQLQKPITESMPAYDIIAWPTVVLLYTTRLTVL
ncbi:hypothetical protein [Ensifer aridi]|uniref:hypothetical protein n=1 Tax=Ensifer aridi TaxID=1708715 RepID=UPI001124F70F|nr:hypothetical protein [Ensifer aridi]